MTPKKRKPEQPDAQIVQGHVLDVLAGMEAESVSCVVTSPPYWSLRKYEAPDIVWGGKPKCKHRWTSHRGNPRGGSGPGAKETGNTYARGESRGATCRCGAFRGQYGREPTRDLYIEHSMMVLRALRRVLRTDGVIWWNLADGRSHRTLCHDLIPERFLLAAEAEGWLVCSKNIWSKPNCMPESAKRRPTDAYEHIFMLAKNPTYWYDSEAVREAISQSSIDRISQPTFDQQTGGDKDYGKGTNPNRSARRTVENLKEKWSRSGQSRTTDGLHEGRWDQYIDPAGRNMRSVWTFPTAQSKDAHFAVFPEELPRRCILASAPQYFCPGCGTPGPTTRSGDTAIRERYWRRYHEGKVAAGLVLDPFAGVGTTGVVARRLGRRFVGIELSQKYCRMAAKRMEQTALGIPL